MITLLRSIRRTTVLSVLEGMRLPLSTAQRLAGQTANEVWAPALLFEDFQSHALQFAGSVLRDDELSERGRLQAAKLSEIRRSIELETEAEQTRREADAKLERDRAAARDERARAEELARVRRAAAARNVNDAEESLEQDVEAAEAEIESIAEQRERAVAATERNARLKATAAESKALARQQAAVAATEHAANLATKLDSKKRERKSS